MDKYDIFLRITIPVKKSHSTSHKISALLKLAYSDRIKLLEIIEEDSENIHMVSKPNKSDNPTKTKSITIGLILNLQNAYRELDLGPSPDNKIKSTEFRKFWGDKSELRRFPDGSIKEAIIWDNLPTIRAPISDTEIEKSFLLLKIARHILSLHYNISSDHVTLIGPHFFIPVLNNSLQSYTYYNSNKNLQNTIQNLFDIIRRLKKIPLKITQIYCTHPAYRSCAPFLPEQKKNLSSILSDSTNTPSTSININNTMPSLSYHPDIVFEAIPIIIQFESSSKWPDDSTVITKLKTAFYIAIGNELRRFNRIPSLVHNTYLDLIVEGFAFRVKIIHKKELMSMDKVDTNILELVELPKHSTLIRSFQYRHQIYGPTVRLMKRWLSCHLFYSYISEETIELLTAFQFCNTNRESTDSLTEDFPQLDSPGSSLVAFYRILLLIINHDWNKKPLIVDIEEDMTVEEKEKIESAFSQIKRDTLPCMCIATRQNPVGDLWTQKMNETSLLKLKVLTKESVKFLSTFPLTPSLNVFTLFKTLFDSFDGYIILDEKQLLFSSRKIGWLKKMDNLTGISSKENYFLFDNILPKSLLNSYEQKCLVNFNPALLLLSELKNKLENIANFYYDVHGGDIIFISLKETGKKHKKLLQLISSLGEGIVDHIHMGYNSFIKCPKKQCMFYLS